MCEEAQQAAASRFSRGRAAGGPPQALTGAKAHRLLRGPWERGVLLGPGAETRPNPAEEARTSVKVSASLAAEGDHPLSLATHLFGGETSTEKVDLPPKVRPGSRHGRVEHGYPPRLESTCRIASWAVRRDP